MPGLIESHAHLSINNTDDLAKLGAIPPEEHTLITMHNARLYLDHGITSCISAASAKPRLDVVIRNAINAGEIPGPRLLAASPWLTVTGGLGDMRTLHMPHVESMAIVVDGPEEYRRVTRELIREGVDIIKLVVSGDSFVPHAGSETTVMSEAEVAAAADVVHAHGKRMSAHARSAEAVKRCVRHGVKVIYHANFADDEAIDLLEANRDRESILDRAAIRLGLCDLDGLACEVRFEAHDDVVGPLIHGQAASFGGGTVVDSAAIDEDPVL